MNALKVNKNRYLDIYFKNKNNGIIYIHYTTFLSKRWIYFKSELRVKYDYFSGKKTEKRLE